MTVVVGILQRRRLQADRIEFILQRQPGGVHRRRRRMPRTLVATAVAVRLRRHPVRNGALDRAAHAGQVVRQVTGGQGGFGGHHPAADVDPDGGGNHRAQSRDHAADGRAFTQMHVGHDRDVLVDEGHPRGIGQLPLGRFFDRHAFGPHPDGTAIGDVHAFVVVLFHAALHNF